jgi:hypothetical protein
MTEQEKGEQKMDEWNKAFKEAMKKRFNEGVEKLYANVSHGKISNGYLDIMNAPEKPVNVQTITDPVIELLKQKFDERSQAGISKYGTTLADNNHDDFLMHLLEEQMDSCAYLMKLILDRRGNNLPDIK